MKNYILLFVMVVAFASCTKDTEPNLPQTTQEKMTAEESEIFLKENISIYDARIRNINESEFVRELYLKNFSNTKWNITNLGFTGYVFRDDGKGNDIVSNDGIFTSIKKFNYNAKIPFSKATISVMEAPIVSPKFLYKRKLEKFSKTYKVRTNHLKVGGEATITCDFEVVSSGCIADSIWDGFGCIAVSNCSFTIGW